MVTPPRRSGEENRNELSGEGCCMAGLVPIL
jgi:hypothetical protein